MLLLLDVIYNICIYIDRVIAEIGFRFLVVATIRLHTKYKTNERTNDTYDDTQVMGNCAI